jgi:ketosteroid isomerase-like protein
VIVRLPYVVSRQRGRGKGSGAEVEQRYALLFEVDKGRIVRLTTYPDLAEALDAAGMSE